MAADGTASDGAASDGSCSLPAPVSCVGTDGAGPDRVALAEARSVLTAADRVVVLTGAGVSAPSGIPTYRGPGGLWDVEPDAEVLSSPPPASMCDPRLRRVHWDRLWQLWAPLRELADGSSPNAAHVSVARASAAWDVTVVTQNVDGFHSLAGSPKVLELHGSLFRSRCAVQSCSLPVFDDRVPHRGAPDCPRCGSPCRPDVVLFSEGLDPSVVSAAHMALALADVLVVVGTSGSVFPAADLPVLARRGGIPVLRVDPGPWLGPYVDFSVELSAPAEQVLPLLFAA